LLDALAGHIAGDRGVVRLAGDLVDLVDVDDPVLGLLDFIVAVLQQLLDDVLDVLTDISSLGKRSRIGDGERHVEEPGQRFRKQRLATTGRTNEQHIALRQFHLFDLETRLQTLVVVVYRHR
jgi:hypothetical protein